MINALPYLKTDGEIVAILPAATIKTEKDRDAWHFVKANAKFEVFGENHRYTFSGCVPRTIMVRISLSSVAPIASISEAHGHLTAAPVLDVEVYRGKIPMFSAPANARGGASIPFVHTTALREGHVDLSQRALRKTFESISGPAVLVPRVGAPSRGKIAVHIGGSIALSDCVIALCVHSVKEAVNLHDRIISNWRSFDSLYSGTGAPYVTTAEVAQWLRNYGCRIAAHSNASRRLTGAIAIVQKSERTL